MGILLEMSQCQEGMNLKPFLSSQSSSQFFLLNCAPDAAEEVRHDEGEDDGLLEERLGRLQTGDVLPANTGVVAYDLAGDLRTAIGHLVHQFSLSFS